MWVARRGGESDVNCGQDRQVLNFMFSRLNVAAIAVNVINVFQIVKRLWKVWIKALLNS